MRHRQRAEEDHLPFVFILSEDKIYLPARGAARFCREKSKMLWFGKDNGKNLGDSELVAGYIPARQIIDSIKPGSESLDVRDIADYTRGIKLLRGMIANTGAIFGEASPSNETTSDFLETLDKNGGVVKVGDQVPHTVGNITNASQKFVKSDHFEFAKERLNELYPRYDVTRNAMFKTAVKSSKSSSSEEAVTPSPPPPPPPPAAAPVPAPAAPAYPSNPKIKQGDIVAPGVKAGRKSRKLGNKFNRCVKSVRQTVRARPKSTKESAAIAICTKSVLQTRGRTMKRYRKGRLVTQKKFRGGGVTCA